MASPTTFCRGSWWPQARGWPLPQPGPRPVADPRPRTLFPTFVVTPLIAVVAGSTFLSGLFRGLLLEMRLSYEPKGPRRDGGGVRPVLAGLLSNLSCSLYYFSLFRD